MRIRLILVSLSLLAGSGAIWNAEPSAAGPKPLRSGTILTGGGWPWLNPALQRSGCEYSPDCLAWLASDCNPALVGHEPMVTASVVDVGALANGRTLRTLAMTAPKIPPWGLWPGAALQFWRESCTEIGNSKLQTGGSELSCDWSEGPGRCKPFRIPSGTKWMTVTGQATTARLSWTLT